MFKPLAALAALTLLASPAIAEDVTSLTVTIEGISKVQGTINLGLFDEAGYTCLLYTSPSPRDLSTSRMPSSA